MENNEKAYYEKVDIDNELKLRKQLAALPPYCKQYFIAIESKTQSRTRLAYAYDLSCFFDYLHENNPICKKMSITEIPLSILESLKPMDLEEYLYNLKVYEKDGMAHTTRNGESSGNSPLSAPFINICTKMSLYSRIQHPK